jgi:hypothetical protein
MAAANDESDGDSKWSRRQVLRTPGRRPLNYHGSEGWASRIVSTTLVAGSILTLCAVWTAYVDNLICTSTMPTFCFLLLPPFAFASYVSGRRSMYFRHVDALYLWYLCFAVKVAGIKQCISFFFCFYVSGHESMCFWCPDAVFLWHLCFAITPAGFKQDIGIRSMSQCLQSLLVQCFGMRIAVLVAWFLGLLCAATTVELNSEGMACEMAVCRCSRCRIRAFDWNCARTTYCSLCSNTRR